jgi:hypothetical protein
MSKKNRDSKRSRSKSGILFSELSKERKALIAAIRKNYGQGPFLDQHHPVWNGMAEEHVKRKELVESKDIHTVITDLNFTYKMGQNKFHSIYVESPAVSDFLKNSDARQSDGNLIIQSATDIEEESRGCGFAVHLPNEKHSIFITTHQNNECEDGNNYTYILFARDVEMGEIPIHEDGRWPVIWDGPNNGGHKETWNILCNLLMYINAFPEFVIDGPPELICGTHGGGRNTRVSGSPDIESVHERSKSSPHMRRGHFRVLRSEKFTKKRFQAVFVRPSMVRGKASTVISPQAMDS